jgi:hypothetical protein
MRTIRTLSAVLCASYLLSSAYATVLTFDNVDPDNAPYNGQVIPFDYGDRVNASNADSGGRTGFDLMHGATPNVAVQMFTRTTATGASHLTYMYGASAMPT